MNPINRAKQKLYILQKFGQIYGKGFWLELMLFPISSIFWNLRCLISTIANSKMLFNWKWRHILSYRLPLAINSLFYVTQAIQINRWGRFGIAKNWGGGDFHIENLIHITPISLYSYQALGIVLPLLGIWGWLFGHVLWSVRFDVLDIFVVMAITAVSSNFITSAFIRQNYNSAGWLFFTPMLWGLINNNIEAASLALVAISLTSLTVFVIGLYFCIVIAAIQLDGTILVSVVPAVVVLVLLMIPGDRRAFRRGLRDTVKSIGATRKEAKYIRTGRSVYTLEFWYYILRYVAFIIFAICSDGWLQALLLSAGLLLYVVNSIIARFADVRTMDMVLLSIGMMVTIQFVGLGNWYALLMYWVFVNAVPAYVQAICDDQHPLRMASLKPVDVSQYVESVNSFLAVLEKGSRLLFVYHDPGSHYDRLFGGYRVIHELPAYVAAVRDFCIMPDWYFIGRHNVRDAPNCWGVESDEIEANIAKWEIDYFVTNTSYYDSEIQIRLLEQKFGVPVAVLDLGELFKNDADFTWLRRGREKWLLFNAKLA